MESQISPSDLAIMIVIKPSGGFRDGREDLPTLRIRESIIFAILNLTTTLRGVTQQAGFRVSDFSAIDTFSR